MKKQSGFSLIELLLVLAIIGIISAIAIPALLSQRARARDRSAVSNMTGTITDIVGQYDRLKEQGLSNNAIVTGLRTYLTANQGANKNPWNAQQPAFASTIGDKSGTKTQSAFLSALGSGGEQGQVNLYVQHPAGSVPGFVGGVVKVANKVNNVLYVRKATAIE